MSKKLQQTLTGAMAAMMATGVVATPAMAATTDVDAIYKAAYNATIKALTEGTQAAVNEARLAIKVLPASLEAAIGEFSKQVDTVQHPILVNIVNAINTAEKTPNQANVNAAKKAIPAELVPQWKNSYSSAVDKIQQGLIDNAVEAVKLAETDTTEENLKVAKELVADLLTADSEGIKTAAKALEEKINAVKLYDLDVTNVVISQTKVTVEFEALEEEATDVTLSVLNNKGEVVKVKAKDSLVKGETTAIFYFVDSLKSRAEGTWTVNGVEINLDEVNLVKDVKDLVTTIGKDKEDLFDLLSKSKLVKNLVDKVLNQEAYLSVIKTAVNKEEIKTLADLQKAVDQANKNASLNDDVKATVKVAVEGTLSNFNALFFDLDLDGVNPDWAKDYRNKIQVLENAVEGTVANAKDMQEKVVDVVNEAKVQAAEADLTTNSKLDDEKITNALELVNKYVVVDTTDKTEVKAKEDRINALKVKLAVAKVNSADTSAAMKTTLKNLETIVNDKDKFDYAKLVNENVISYVVKANTGVATDVNGVKSVLQTGQQAAINEVVVKIVEKATVVDTAAAAATEAQKTALIDAYNELVKVSAKADRFDKELDAKLINKDLVIKYAALSKLYTSATTVTDVVNDLESVNDSIVANELAPSNTPVNSAANLLTALKNIGINNLVDTNSALYYSNITVVFDSGDNKVKDVITTGTEWTRAGLQSKVDSVNAFVTLLASNDVATVKNNLTIIAANGGTTLTDYLGYTEAVKADIAELLIARIANGQTIDELTKASTGLNTVYNAIDTIRKSLMTNLNNGNPTMDNTVAALQAASSEFAKLSIVKQYEVADAFHTARPRTTANGVTTIDALKDFTAIRTVLVKVMN